MKKGKAFIRKCMAAVMSGVMLTSVCAANVTSSSVGAAGKFLINSDFESNYTGWGLYKESGGVASIGTRNGALVIDITDQGKKTYSVQPNFDIIPLYQNGVYRMKFDVWSSVPRFMEVMIQLNGGDYHSYMWKGINSTTEPQNIEIEFVMEDESDIMSKLCFNCGLQEEHDGGPVGAHQVYLDNFTLELVDDSKVNYDSTKPVEYPIVVNQVGYRTNGDKKAVIRNINGPVDFQVIDASTEKAVFSGTTSEGINYSIANETDYVADFSNVTDPGTYYIKSPGLEDSYTFTIADDPYKQLLDDSVYMLYLQRCGCEVKDEKFGHPACHDSIATIYNTNQQIDVSGGWHDAGDFGRYVVPAAKAVADLMYAYINRPERYSGDINAPDVLDEVRYELEWMMKMQDKTDGGVYHKVSCASFPGFVMPQLETDPLIVMPKTTTSTADFAASMALAYEVYKDLDRSFANSCLEAAKKSYEWAKANPGELYLANPADISTGAYEDKNASDELYWAACQLYRATGDERYAADITSIKTGLDWALVGDYGNIAILTMDGADKNSAIYKNAESAVIKQAETFTSNSQASPYGVSLNRFVWGSNMTVANAGIICSLAYRITGDEKYIKAANENLNYLLGRNPNSICYVTGYGTVSPQNPHHRPSIALGEAMKGMLVGGVNSDLDDSAAKAYLADAPSAKCYVDNDQSYSTNEITIYWNSPLIYLLTLTRDSAQAIPTDKKGDVNLDGTVDIADLVKLQNHVLGRTELTSAEAKNADVCKDDQIDSFDTAMLRRIIIG